MAPQRTIKAIRSPVTGKVFEAFISELRAANFDKAACDRLEDALLSGRTINADNLREALFPRKKADGQ